jgi:integrase
MSRTPTEQPRYLLHKQSGQAYVFLDGKQYLLGRHNSQASRQRYDRVIGEWLAGGRRVAYPSEGPTLTSILEAFWSQNKGKIGKTEAGNYRSIIRHLRRLYGTIPAKQFDSLALEAWRERMIRPDEYTHPKTETTIKHIGWCRGVANDHTTRVRRIFKWAASRRLVPIETFQLLQTIDPLKRGQTEARESKPVRPAMDHLIRAAMRLLPAPLQALVQLQELAGGRGGELLIMRGCDIDTSDRVWVYTPSAHKNQFRGMERKIYLGPRCQQIIAPFLNRIPTAFLFSPREAEATRRQQLHEQRKTPASQGNAPGTNQQPKPKRSPGDHYTAGSYRRAVQRALELAFPPPAELARKRIKSEKRKERWETRAEWRGRLGADGWAELQEWIKSHRFHPHQLRHNFATNTRKQHGIEAASILLGHSDLKTSLIYAEKSSAVAHRIAAEIA